MVPLVRTSAIFTKYVQVVESRQSLQEEFLLDGGDAEPRWLSQQIVALADGLAITSRDVTASKRDEVELRNNRAFLQSLIDYLPVSIYVKGVRGKDAGKIVIWNKSAEIVTGYAEKDMLGRRTDEIFSPSMTRAFELHDASVIENPMPVHVPSFPFRRADGTVRMVSTTSVPLFDAQERVAYILGISVDITMKLQQERALKDKQMELAVSENRLRVTLNSIGDAVITTDTDGNVMYLNPVAQTMTGWTTEEAAGLPLPTVFHIVDELTNDVAPNPLGPVLRNEKAVARAENTMLVQRGGARFSIKDSAAPILDPQDGILGAVLVFHDVSEAHKMAAQLSHQATHDALTGLINRREFERRLELALQTAKLQDKQHTLLYLDLDQFKIVNDTCGHVAGDELLRQLSTILRDKLRQSDTLARLGGDEFGVLLENCSHEPALRIADLLRQTVSDFHFVWLDKIFPIGVSIGLATFSNGGVTLADILRMADAACYVAKDKGRNRIHVYTQEDKELAQRHGEMGWIGRIQKALDEQRFVLYSQKILPLARGDDSEEHYELLLRMRDADGELVPPMAFIPAAERYGLMPLLDRWVIKTAFSQYASRHPRGGPRVTCAINLSGTSICDENFLKFVRDQFDRYDVPPASICFEVTETSAIANLSHAAVLIRELKAIGCRFSLDDFGSGMSSFAYLKHLPVDYLKIDGGFVKDMVNDPIDHAMVEAINRIGHVMGIQTIAEFVENDAILEALRTIGVDFAQGYGVEMPKPTL